MPTPDIPTEMAAVRLVINQTKAQVSSIRANLRQKLNKLKKAQKKMSFLQGAKRDIDEYEKINHP